jgi:protein SCO1/2
MRSRVNAKKKPTASTCVDLANFVQVAACLRLQGPEMVRRVASLVLSMTVSWSATLGAQPAPLLGLRLQDQSALLIAPEAFTKYLVLMNFVFTGCSSTCPLQVQELAELRRALPPDVARAVQFLSITVDPMSDTPAALLAFAQRMGADQAGWRFATGAPADIDRLIGRMRAIDPRKKDPQPSDHSTALYLFDESGVLVQRYGGVPVDRGRLAAELTQLARRHTSR